MALPKLPIKDVLAAIDMGAKSVWNELSDEERKSVSFWLLNRYVSAVKGSREDQEMAVFKTNEYYNKHFNTIGVGKDKGHQKLMFHPYIGFKKKAGNNNAAVKLLSQVYPNMKLLEIDMLADMSTKKELKQLAEQHSIEGIKL